MVQQALRFSRYTKDLNPEHLKILGILIKRKLLYE